MSDHIHRDAPAGMDSLKSYTLTLEGAGKDTNVNDQELSQETHLLNLNLSLRAKGAYSPAPQLEAFVCKAAPSLATLNNLTVHMHTVGPKPAAAPAVTEALSHLVEACPVVTTSTFEGPMPPAFLRKLGESCPALSFLTIAVARDKDAPRVQELVALLPSSFPNLATLNLPGLCHILPDMSTNQMIATMDLRPGFVFISDAQWRALPHNLQYLSVQEMKTGPPPTNGNGEPLLSSLLSLNLTVSLNLLDRVALLLRAAPNLEAFISGVAPPSSISKPGGNSAITCNLCPTTAADMATLHTRMKSVTGLRTASYCLICDERLAVGGTVASLINALPAMTEVAQVEIVACLNPALLKPLLTVKFPDVEALTLRGLASMDDSQLQAVVAAKRLTALRLVLSKCVSPIGILTLCQAMPSLAKVSVLNCGIGQSALDRCAKQLDRSVILVAEADP